MRTAIELLRMLESTSEGVDDDGFRTCHHCPASGWGFLEHDKDCPIREARAMLGKCRHGYTRGFDHGEGCCQSADTPMLKVAQGIFPADVEEVGYLVEPDEDLPGLGLLQSWYSDGSEEIAAKVEDELIFPTPYGKRIIRNAAQCRKCGDIIESKSVHDYEACTCGTIFVDGGLEYLRRGYGTTHDLIELSETTDGEEDDDAIRS